MSEKKLKRWERSFRKPAESDDYAVLCDHLHRLDLPDEPEMLLHGTIVLVQACCAYATLDGQRSLDGFLQLQSYFPGEAPGAKYAFTFDLCGKGLARVLLPAKVGVLDLADLYGHPWWEYERCGYSRLWISRTDGKDLTEDELLQIQDEVIDDLRFDYSEDELDFWFNDSAVQGALLIELQDVEHFDDEDEWDE